MAGILDMLGFSGGQTPMNTNQTPILYENPTGFGSMTAAGQGILNQPQSPGGFDFGQGLMAVGRGLSIAGSRNPTETAAAIAQMDREQREAMKPKITPLANGAFSLVAYPDGRTEIVNNEKIQEFLKEEAKLKNTFTIDKIKATADANVGAAITKEVTKDQVKNADGATQTANAVSELNAVANELEGTPNATGPVIGLVPKVARDVITPTGGALQDRAERIIQQSLRQTLGGQFTQNEADRFLARSYNPRLSEAENARRLRDMAAELDTIQKNKDAALEYLKKNKTLDGFSPTAAPTSANTGMTNQNQSSGGGLTAEQVKAINPNAVYEPGYVYQVIDGKLRRMKAQ